MIPVKWLLWGFAAAGLAATHLAAYEGGREAVMRKLQDDRITILQDGRKIDERVLRADDFSLCNMLGGCGVPDDSD